jgi:hypothetical protein
VASIDLAFKTADGWPLIDYKTDQLGPGVDQLTARYAPQIRAYADRWSAQLGTTTRAGLHSSAAAKCASSKRVAGGRRPARICLEAVAALPPS